MSAMFAPKVAKAKAAASSANGSAYQRSALVAQRPHDKQEVDAVSPTTRAAACGVSWNFSKIPLFPPERAGRSQASSPIPGTIQPKLAVGAVDDPLEREADGIAEQVMRKPDPEFSSIAALQPGHKSAISAEQELRAKADERPGAAATEEAPSVVQEVLRSPGAPLSHATRSFMEPKFGRDFSHVRVHADARGAESAQAVGANAYTVGWHIVFARGRFEPASAGGGQLLAHELVHVIQQSSAARPRPQEPRSACAGKQARIPAPILLPAGQPKVQRKPQLHLSLPRATLKGIGNPDVTEIIDKLPNTLMNGQEIEVKQVTIDGVQHKFMLSIEIIPGKPPQQAAAETTPMATSGPQNNIHTTGISIFQELPDPARTLFHELLHARLEIDKILPPDQQSETFGRYSQQLAMATDPSLLIVTGTKPLEVAVLDGIAKIRSWYQKYVTGFVMPPALGPERDINNFLEHWINEKFAGQEAGAAKIPPRPGTKAVSRAVTNSSIARRYAGNVDHVFNEYASQQNLDGVVAQAVEQTKSAAALPDKDDLNRSLEGALVQWFDALDREKAEIEKFKREPPVSAPQGAGNPYPPPLGIGGKPVR
jgi:hypothetical protein